MRWLSVPGNVTSAVIEHLQHDAATSLQYAVSAEVMTSPLSRLVSSGMSPPHHCAFSVSQRQFPLVNRERKCAENYNREYNKFIL